MNYPHPCCRCGLCCLSETCPVGQSFYGIGKHDPCPGLAWEGDRSVCRLVDLAGEHIMGVGAGCCIKARAIAQGREYDFASLPPDTKRFLAQRRKATNHEPRTKNNQLPTP